MKKSLLVLAVFFSLASISTRSNAQAPTFDCYLTNDTFISPTVYQFDIYLLRTGTNVFEYAAGQWGIGVSSACANGGTLTPSVVAGSSQLGNLNQVPITVGLPSATHCFNVAGRAPPAAGNGSIISNVDSGGCSSPGTRIGTFRITNTVAFSCTCLNLTFNFVAAAGKTQTMIFTYDSTIVTNITANGTFYQYNTPGNCLKYCSTGISEPIFNNALSVYPNPAKDQLAISSWQLTDKEVAIELFNILGVKVFDRLQTANRKLPTAIDIQPLADGIYFVKVSNSDGEWVGRFVKQ